jgi:penicillin-binding protein 1C
VRTALACSYNVPAVRVARRLGAAALLETLHDAGFASLTRPPSHYGVGLTLGNGEVQLLELARAYAGLARGGTLPPVRLERHRVTARGDTLRTAPEAPTPMRYLTPALAHVVTDILRDPEARAPAFGRGGPLELPFPAAAKTGTSKDFRDNWTVGFTPRHTVAVWAGNFDGTPMQSVSGVAGAGPLFQAILRALGPGGPFARPAHGLTTARVCPASGLRPGAACPTTRTEPFLAGTAPADADTCRVHRRVRLDARSGLLASAATPPAHVETRVFAVHPPVFHAWMRAHGVPLPPTLTHAAVHAAEAEAAWSDDVATTDALRVRYPADGTRYRRDPVLRPGYQRLHLDGAAPEGWLDVHWRADGQRLAGGLHTATWRLAEGTHTLALHAVAPDGQRYRSRPATVRVFAHAPLPWADSTTTETR